MAGLSNFTSVIDRWNSSVPGGQDFVYYVNRGFVVIALVAVIILAFRGNETRNRLKANKPKNKRPARSKTNELGSGDLAVKEQIKPWLEKTDKYDTILPVKNLKGGDGIALKEGNLIIPVEERNRHVLIIAKTGSGKTTRAILPVLFNDVLCPERSSIVLDSKPEMWDKLVGMARKYNPKKKILLFNPLDTERSLSWNILAKITTDTDAKLIANTIISATDNPSSRSDSPFFRNNALALLNSIMVGLLNDNDETLSIPRVHQLANGGMENLCKWLEAHPQAIRNSKTFVDLARSGSQNADTIMSELGMRLAAWDLTAIRATTALDELDLESLIAEPTLLIVELRESELEMLRPLANVVVVEMLRYLTKRAESFPGGKLPRPIGLVIDEFASALGRLPDIHVKLNTLRSRNVSIFAAIQSIAQIKSNYDREADSVLAGFSTKIFMPTLDFQDAEWASKESGTMTVRFNVNSMGKNKRLIDYFATKNDNLQEQVQQRAVLTPDEIGRPADNAATFYMPNTPVFQGHLVPYYEHKETYSRFNSVKGFDYKLRESPILYEENYEYVPSPVASVEAQKTNEEILAEVERLKPEFAYDAADSISKEWWASLEQLNEKNPQSVLNLCKQLTERKLTLAEFYAFYANSGIDSVDALFQSLDKNRLEQLRYALGWDLSNQHAKDWWASFEEANKNNIPVVLELGHELLKRAVSIDDFFSAYVHSESTNVPDVLKYLDQLIEEKRKEIASEDGYAVSHNESEEPPVPLSSADDDSPYEVWDENKEEHSSLNEQIEKSFYLEEEKNNEELNEGLIHEDLEETDIANSASEYQSVEDIIDRKERHFQAKLNVHVKSYLEMAEELVSGGKIEDFNKLVGLAKEDKLFPKEFISELEDIGNKVTSL